jgi:hypothetical protein
MTENLPFQIAPRKLTELRMKTASYGEEAYFLKNTTPVKLKSGQRIPVIKKCKTIMKNQET